ncbi:UNVERIFIED_CONTAM: zinc finger and BTB domain-containing protein 46 [Trichonephila clavipes]
MTFYVIGKVGEEDVSNLNINTTDVLARNSNGFYQGKILSINRKIYSCSYCTYSTPGRGNLKRHNLIHSGERPYVCNLCSKSFRQKTHLKHHLLVHIK